MLHIAAFTVVQALLSTAIAAAVGLCAAFFIARRHFFLRRLLSSLSSVPLCLPALIMALGYVTFFGMSGFANKAALALLHTKQPFFTLLYSMPGIVLAQGFYNFPLVMATVGASWATLSPEQANAARLLGASELRVFRTITLHELLPSLGAACIPVFLFCFFSFMIVLLFGGVGCTTLEVEIYHSINSNLNIPRALSLAGIETGIALAVVTLYSICTERNQKTKKATQLAFATPKSPIRGIKERVFFAAFLVLITLFFLAPLAGIAWNALTTQKNELSLKNFIRICTMESFLPALKGTFVTALATGLCSATLAFAYAVFLRAHEHLQNKLFFRVIPLLPMALSSVVIGSFLTLTVRRGSIALLVLAQTVLFWPFAFRQVYAQALKIPAEALDAARLLSKRPLGLDTLRGVYIPCCAKSTIRAAGFCFAMSAGDTTLPLVMAIRGFNSLSLFTYRLAGRYRFHEACAAGLLLALLCMVVFALSQALQDR